MSAMLVASLTSPSGAAMRAEANANLIDAIEDYDVINHYRENGRLHVHSEYGYLVNETTARLIAEWWREYRPELAPRPIPAAASAS